MKQACNIFFKVLRCLPMKRFNSYSRSLRRKLFFYLKFFSQAVIADKTMYVSGQLGLNPEVNFLNLHVNVLY